MPTDEDAEMWQALFGEDPPEQVQLHEWKWPTREEMDALVRCLFRK